MKQDIDQSHGERVVRKGGTILFYGTLYKHYKLLEFVGQLVKVKGYGYDAIDVYSIERRSVKGRGVCWGRGQFICMIES